MARATSTVSLAFGALAFAGATIFAAVSAAADTVVERRLAAVEPCSGLEQKVGGFTLALDHLEGVSLSRANLEMVGDTATLSFVGGLACRTSDSAMLPGNGSVDIEASTTMNLADCSIPSLSIVPTSFGGSYGGVLEAAWVPLILPEIEAEARKMLVDACKDFVAAQ